MEESLSSIEKDYVFNNEEVEESFQESIEEDEVKSIYSEHQKEIGKLQLEKPLFLATGVLNA